jgi:hypothetical protein
MAIQKLEKEKIDLIIYKREGYDDLVKLKAILDSIAADTNRQADIALDLTRNPSINENELGLLVALARKIEKTPRRLLLIATGNTALKLKNFSLMKTGKVVLYENHTAFLGDINKAGNAEDTAGKQPAPGNGPEGK